MKNAVLFLSFLFFTSAHSQGFEITLLDNIGITCEPSDSIVSGGTLIYENVSSIEEHTIVENFVIRSLSNDTVQIRLDRKWILENDIYAPNYFWGSCSDPTVHIDTPFWESLYYLQLTTIDSTDHAYFRFIAPYVNELEVPLHARYYVLNVLEDETEEKVDSFDIVISPFVSVIENRDQMEFSVNSVTKSLKLISPNLNTRASISIFDVNGKVVLQEEKQLNNEDNIDLLHLHSGIYFIRVNDQNGQLLLRKKFFLNF